MNKKEKELKEEKGGCWEKLKWISPQMPSKTWRMMTGSIFIDSADEQSISSEVARKAVNILREFSHSTLARIRKSSLGCADCVRLAKTENTSKLQNGIFMKDEITLFYKPPHERRFFILSQKLVYFSNTPLNPSKNQTHFVSTFNSLIHAGK